MFLWKNKVLSLSQEYLDGQGRCGYLTNLEINAYKEFEGSKTLVNVRIKDRRIINT